MDRVLYAYGGTICLAFLFSVAHSTDIFSKKNHFGIYLYFIKKYLFKVSVTFREVRPDVRRTESYFQIELNLFRTGNAKEESLIKQV